MYPDRLFVVGFILNFDDILRDVYRKSRYKKREINIGELEEAARFLVDTSPFVLDRISLKLPKNK